MATKVYLNGSVVDEENAMVSVFDRGFLYGDSVYEVTRTSGGRPVDLWPHLDRLQSSASKLALPCPDNDRIAAAIEQTLAAAHNPESYLRVVVTRGGGPITLRLGAPVEPTFIVIAKPLEVPDTREGIAVWMVGVQRTSYRAVDPSVKSGNYLNNILALDEAVRANADEAIMCNFQGNVAEGSTSNVFLVSAGRLLTPALDAGILSGITRMRILSLAEQEGLPVAETAISPDELRRADEVFITSSVRGVAPVRLIDGQKVGAETPGPITERLIARYRHFLQAVANGEA